MVTITDFKSKSSERKTTIVINGRVHPGETNASWALHGFMRFLLSKSTLAKQLRKRIVFKIIPILNVDGVVAGNYRCSFAGLDINRMFGPSANKRLNPESNLVKELAKEKKIGFYFDIHGHSNKKSAFMYGPRYPLHSEHYMNIRLLPKLM
jgi:murein tripeptide amidase MpaA